MTTSTSAPAGGLVLSAITPTDEPAARTTASGSGPISTVKWRWGRFDYESIAVNTHPRAVPRGEYALRRLIMKGRAFEKERAR